jgi:adenosylmethionine-8-amino-7-oxononanoate aminotransferase
MDYKGLIPGKQESVQVDTKHWKFGMCRDGKKIVDSMLHYGAFPLGYDDHGIIDKVCRKLKVCKPETGDNLFKAFEPTLNNPHIELSNKLYEMSKGYRSVYTLSGSDAIEVAIKLAFAYHEKQKNSKKKIVSFTDAYHGSTLLSLSCGDVGLEKAYHGMNPYQDVIKISPDMHEEVDWTDVACIVVETCTHYQTINPYGFEVWEKIKLVQQKHDVIVIIDDIFMGGGKTGNFFGFSQLPIHPDIFVMGKSITGGFFPLSVAMYSEKVNEQLNDALWLHGHTYSFCLSGVLSMLEYIKVLEETNYMNNVDSLVLKAKKYFIDAGFEIVGNYGLVFLLAKNTYKFRFMLPLNADEEYFEAVPETLKQLDEKWSL